MRRRWLRGAGLGLSWTLTVAGCASSPSSEGDGGTPLDGRASEDGASSWESVPVCEMLPLGGANLGEEPFRRDELCCAEDRLHPPPTTFATILDLSDREALEVGTCATFKTDTFPFYRAIPLPEDRDAYPLAVFLPALEQADPACLDLCIHGSLEPTQTAFGVALETPLEIVNGGSDVVLAVSVAPPWYVVSGGTGEASAWPCLEGYQEFGVQSCVAVPYGGIGFATNDPQAPSVRAILELVPTNGITAAEYAETPCCVYSGD